MFRIENDTCFFARYNLPSGAYVLQTAVGSVVVADMVANGTKVTFPLGSLFDFRIVRKQKIMRLRCTLKRKLG